MLFLYTQANKESVNEYARNFKCLWDTVEAFGGSPEIHKGLVKGILALPGQVSNPNNITEDEQNKAEEEVADTVKAVLLISRANKQRYGRLKEQLANNYLLGMDQYPDTLEKASRILGNYQIAKASGKLPGCKGIPPWRLEKCKQRRGTGIHPERSLHRTRVRWTQNADHRKRSIRGRCQRQQRRCWECGPINAVIRSHADKQRRRQPLLPLRG
jgi:hypothetical protein